MSQPQPITPKPDDELKAFLLVFRRALLLVVRYVEDRYELNDSRDDKRKKAA